MRWRRCSPRRSSMLIAALATGHPAFWRDIGEPIGGRADSGSICQAIRDAGRVGSLDRGGVGCFNEDDRPTDPALFITSPPPVLLSPRLPLRGDALSLPVGTRSALPVVGPAGGAGTLGGIGLLIGPVGLFIERSKPIPRCRRNARTGMDIAFIATLFRPALPAWRCRCCATAGDGAAVWRCILAWCSAARHHAHGKFVHGIYRFVAPVRYPGAPDVLWDLRPALKLRNNPMMGRFFFISHFLDAGRNQRNLG